MRDGYARRGMAARVTILTLALVMVLPRPAAAYIDPGSAAFGLQALLAIVATVMVGLRRYIGDFARSLGWRRSPEVPGPESSDSSDA